LKFMNGRKNRTPELRGRVNLVKIAVSAALLSLTACGGGGSDEQDELTLGELQNVPPALAAANATLEVNTDIAESVAGSTITVTVLQNDNFSNGSQLQLVGTPANGTARLLDSGQVEYTPNAGFVGTDTVAYALVDAAGNRMNGALYIAVVAENVSDSGFPFCANADADPDNDGYGWENDATCEMPGIGLGTGALLAKGDNVTMGSGTVTAVSPMRNDSIPDRANVVFEIDSVPTAGSIEGVDAGILVYSAPEDFHGSDSIVYSITDQSGNTSSASIEFTINCTTCDLPEALRLSWPANPSDENVEGYRVFFGPDENTFTSTMLADVTAADFTGSAPFAVFEMANDLNVSGTDGGCFTVQAYRNGEDSEHSPRLAAYPQVYP